MAGRPKKRACSSRPNAGRKKIKLTQDENVSSRTIDRRARDLISREDVNRAVLLRALQFLEKEEGNQENQEDNNQEAVDNLPQPHTPQSALAFFLENDYTVNEYNNLAKDCKKRSGTQVYPPYHHIEEEKKSCLAGLEFTVQTESTCQITMQSLLNKSAKRLIESVDQEESISDAKLKNCVLYVSYGFDSSSGHKNAHQEFENEGNKTLDSHQSLFASVLVILALKHNDEFIWINETPQSVRYCRPLRLSFESETSQVTKRERDRLRAEVNALIPHNFNLNGKDVEVSFNVDLTLLDGKALNNVLDNDATTRCPICLLTMKNFNSDEAYNTDIPEQRLKHGLGLLHCEIKVFEWLLHLSYKLNLGLHSWNCPSGLKRKY